MKIIITVISILLSLQTYALSLESLFNSKSVSDICEDSVYSQDSKLNLKGPYFSKNNNFLVSAVKSNLNKWSVYKINSANEKELLTKYSQEISAIKAFNESVYILRDEYIDILNINTGTLVKSFKTHNYSFSVSGDYRAFDFDIKDNIIYVAHGGVGVTVLERDTGRFINTQDLGLSEQFGGQESKVIAISVGRETSVVTVAPISKPADGFYAINGLIKFNTNNFNGIKLGKYHNSQAAISENTKMALNNGAIFLSNKGFQESVKEIQLNFGGLIFPTKKKLSINKNDQNIPVEIIGNFFKEGKSTYACARVNQGNVYSGVVIK